MSFSMPGELHRTGSEQRSNGVENTTWYIDRRDTGTNAQPPSGCNSMSIRSVSWNLELLGQLGFGALYVICHHSNKRHTSNTFVRECTLDLGHITTKTLERNLFKTQIDVLITYPRTPTLTRSTGTLKWLLWIKELENSRSFTDIISITLLPSRPFTDFKRGACPFRV